MKILYSWLKDFIDINLTPEELEKKFISLGIEVASVTKKGADFEGVYAAKITLIEPHPNADKLHLVTLDTAWGKQRVVCGAKNIALGQTVPLAKVGARLGAEVLKPETIRGVLSDGMLCSADELGLTSVRQSGILLLGDEVKIGTDVKTLYGKSDIIFDLELTPNRPDLMSHLGVARELAILLNLPLKTKKIEPVKGSGKSLDINILAADGCPRYNGRIIRNVKNVQSPDWLKERLSAMDVNPKNALVDITNYVLFEIGHPMHAFDLNHLEGGQINVRWANEGEKFLGLDGVERNLTVQNLVIADGKKPVALAGVIGGAGDSILPETKDIFLESAYFYPPCINKTSKKFGISTEASQRYERGTDIDNCRAAMDLATKLVLEICGGEPSETNDVYPVKYEPQEIKFTPAQINKILGMEVSAEKQKEIISKLGDKFNSDGEVWSLTPVTYRRDLTHRWDLAEEVARHAGLENLAAQDSGVTHASLYFGENPKNVDLGEKFSNALASMGFYECKNFDFCSLKDVQTFGFSSKTAVEIKNPLAEGMEYMRPALLLSLLKNLEFNQRFGRHDLSLFEYGKTFEIQKGYPLESFALAGVMCGKTPRSKFFAGESLAVDFYRLKGVIAAVFEGVEGISLAPCKEVPSFMHPKLTADILFDGRKIGLFGKVHPLTLKAYDVKTDVWAFEFSEKPLEKKFDAQQFKKARDISIYPSSWRDLSVVIDKGVTYAQVEDVLNTTGINYKYSLIDLYQGANLPEGKKSITLRFEFSHSQRTLTDKEVSQASENILNALKTSLGAALR